MPTAVEAVRLQQTLLPGIEGSTTAVRQEQEGWHHIKEEEMRRALRAGNHLICYVAL